MGANFNNLTNRDKTIIICALTSEYKVNNLLKTIKLAKSTYYYKLKAVLRNKYGLIKSYLKTIFTNNYRCYGYRRMKMALLKNCKINLSEKVVRKLMYEEHLIVFSTQIEKKIFFLLW